MQSVRFRSVSKLARVAAVTLAATAIGVLYAPTASASTGGGCWEDNSHAVRTCISASGNRLEPDLYILNNARCKSVQIYVWDVTSGKRFWEDDAVTNGCTPWHHGPWALDSANTGGAVVKGHQYQAYAGISSTMNPTNEFAGAYSPPLVLSY